MSNPTVYAVQIADKVVKTETQSYLSRVGESAGTSVTGFIVVGISVGVLWWNEHRSFSATTALTELRSAVASSSSLAQEEEGKIVHISDEIQCDEKVTDSEFVLLNLNEQTTEQSTTTPKPHISDNNTDNKYSSANVTDSKESRMNPESKPTPWGSANTGNSNNTSGNSPGGPQGQGQGGPISNAQAKRLLFLQRLVEMYQWRERTTYTYSREWSSSLHSDADFQEQRGHENPRDFPVQSRSFSPSVLKIGRYTVPAALIVSALNAHHIKPDFILPLSSFPLSSRAQLAQSLSNPTSVENLIFTHGIAPQGGYYYLTRTQSNEYKSSVGYVAQVGDLRLQYRGIYLPQRVSMIGRIALNAENNSLTLMAPDQNVGLLVAPGRVSAGDMISSNSENVTYLTWALRLFSTVANFLGFKMILSPFVQISGLVPLVSKVVSLTTDGVSVISALSVCGITIPTAWLHARTKNVVLTSGIKILYVGLMYLFLSRFGAFVARNAVKAVKSAGRIVREESESETEK